MAKLSEVLGRPEFQDKKIDVSAVATLGSYENPESGELVDFVAIALTDPFNDPDFTDIRIKAKWKSDEGLFKFYGKKALRASPEIEFDLQIKVCSYRSKKSKKTVRYLGIVGKSPFNNNAEIEFEIQRENDAAVFRDLAAKAFGITEALEEEADD